MTAQILTTETSIDIAALVEDLEGTYTSREKGTYRQVAFPAAEVARRIREAIALGARAEFRTESASAWTVEINNGRGSSYGRYIFNG